jgi:hypothetical protein
MKEDGMKALNLAIYTGKDEGHKVTMAAEFDNHEEAVRFHEGVARLCRDARGADRPVLTGGWLRLLESK